MKKLFTLSFLLASVFVMQAKVELPPIFADNMVLQQQTEVALWGYAKPNAKLTITTTWSKAKTITNVDADGKWFARVATPVAGGPYEITFSDGEKSTLKNVLIGEVWICSGQSNMEMPMKGFSGQPVDGATDLILGAKTTTWIRSCNLEQVKSFELQNECPATWYEHTPQGGGRSERNCIFLCKETL